MTSSDGRTWLSVLGLLLLAATNHTARASSLAVGFADGAAPTGNRGMVLPNHRGHHADAAVGA